MELIEQINILKDEVKNHLLMIDSINAEKTALDQMYIFSLKELLNCRKDLILQNSIIHNMNVKLELLSKEKDELQHTVNFMSSKVQATE